MRNLRDLSEYRGFGIDIFIHNTAIIKHPQLCDIGSHNAIDNGVTISTELIMGDYIHIAPYVVVIGGKKSKLILNDFSFVASGTKIVCGSEDYTGAGLVGPTIPEEYRELTYSTVTFEKYAGCGVNCSIMPGVTLAEGSILGANSLLTKDTEPWTIYVGSPAKPVKIRNKEKIINYSDKLKNG
jgi:acetyltransferase-like isoleucine patch superfamily enzyme